MKNIIHILISLLLVSCSTTYKDFVQYSMDNKSKYPNGYCVYSIAETYDGRFPPDYDMDGVQVCHYSLDAAMGSSLQKCVSSKHRPCMVAFHFDSNENKILKYETTHIERMAKLKVKKDAEFKQQRYERELAAKEKTASKCDGYGFTRNTNEHSNCMLQIDTSEKLEQQSREAQYIQQQQLKKLERQQALDSLNNSLQNINRSVNPPSVTCNPNISGGVTCK